MTHGLLSDLCCLVERVMVHVFNQIITVVDQIINVCGRLYIGIFRTHGQSLNFPKTTLEKDFLEIFLLVICVNFEAYGERF